MNQKDCENIGYVLSEYRVPKHVCDALFKLDSRIEEEYIGFSEVLVIHEAVDERAEELVISYNGHDWAIRKNLAKTYAECLEEARREIYGEDYHPSMFR